MSLKNSIYSLMVIILCFSSCQSEKEGITQAEALTAFAKLYGYVKYFHPSDEAQEIDWDAFAVYGAEQVSKCGNRIELVNALETLFKPIAPSLKLSFSESGEYDLKTITPADTSGYVDTYWQHQGLSLGMDYYIKERYNSIRVNANNFNSDAELSGNLLLEINAKPLLGKHIKFVSRVKEGQDLSPSITSWLRFYGGNNKIIETKSYGLESTENPIWQEIEIMSIVPADSEKIRIGTYLFGKGKAYISDYSIFFEENEEWIHQYALLF